MNEKQLDRIESKLIGIEEHLSRVDVTLAEQHMSLRTHMRRTAALEKELAPISKYMNRLQGAVALFGVMATIIAIIEGLRTFHK